MSWEDGDLLDASFDNAMFFVQSTTDTLSRKVVEHRYQNRDGAEYEDQGREPRPTEIEAFLDGDNYLVDLFALMQAMDKGEVATLVHPLLGSWDARLTNMQMSHDWRRHDYVSLRLSFKEDAVDSQLPDLLSIDAAKSDLEQKASEVSVAAIDNDLVDETSGAISDAENMPDDIDSIEGTLDARLNQLQAYIKNAEDQIDSIADDVTGIVRKDVVKRSLRGLELSAARLKEIAEATSAQIVDFEVRHTTTAKQIALELYGDPDRDVDILKLNEIADPYFIDGLKVIKVHDR